MRRGEALALLWRDVDLDAGRIAVRRSLGVVKTKGQGGELVEGPPRPGSRGSSTWTPGPVAALSAYRAVRGSLRWIWSGTTL